MHVEIPSEDETDRGKDVPLRVNKPLSILSDKEIKTCERAASRKGTPKRRFQPQKAVQFLTQRWVELPA
jgi:hypothetical protein